MESYAEFLSFVLDQISRRVFELMKSECTGDGLVPSGTNFSGLDTSKMHFKKEDGCSTRGCLGKIEAGNCLVVEKDGRSKSVPFELYKRRTTVVVRRETFLDVVCSALTEYKYMGPNQRADLVLACR